MTFTINLFNHALSYNMHSYNYIYIEKYFILKKTKYKEEKNFYEKNDEYRLIWIE